MRNSKTTIRELSAKYRSVLKKCLLLNAMIIGLTFASNANATINVVNSFNPGTTDATVTTSDIENDVVAAVINSAETTQTSNIFDLSNSGAHYGDGSSLTIDMSSVTSINEGDYNFDYNGTSTALNTSTQDDGAGHLSKTLYTDAGQSTLSGKTSSDLSSYVSLDDGQIARAGLKYTDSGYDFTLGTDTDGDATSKTGALTSGNFKFTSTYTGAGSVVIGDVNVGNTSFVDYTTDTDGTIATAELKKDAYTFDTAADGVNVQRISANDLSVGAISAADYQYLAGDGTTWYVMVLDDNGDLIIPSAALADTVAVANASSALTAYNADKATFTAKSADFAVDEGQLTTAVTSYNTAIGNFNELARAYDEDYVAAYDAANTAWTTSDADYVAALGEYTTDSASFAVVYPAYTAYGNSIASTIDERATQIVTDAVGTTPDGNNIASTNDVGTNLGALDAAVGDTSNLPTELGVTTVAEAIEKTVDVIGDVTNGYDTTSTGSHLTAFDDSDPSNIVGDVVSNMNALDDAIIANENAIGTTADGNYVAAANDIGTNLGALDTQVKANADDIADIQTDITVTAAGNYISAGSNVAANLGALDTQVKTNADDIADIQTDITVTAAGNYISAGSDVAANLGALDTQVKANTDAIGTTSDGNYVAAANSVGTNLGALDTQVKTNATDIATNAANITAETTRATAAETALNTAITAETTRATAAEAALDAKVNANQASNDARFVKVDQRIDKLENKMEKGLAANNALAGLVPLDHEHPTQISAAMGGYKDKTAIAVGAFHYITDNALLNAGAAYGGNDNISYKAGITFGF